MKRHFVNSMAISERIGTCALWLLNRLPRLFSQRNTRKIGRFCGRSASLFVRREFAVFEAQLDFVRKSSLPLKRVDARQLFLKMFEHLGESVAENFYFDELLRQVDPEEKMPYPDYVCIEHLGRDVAERLAGSGRAYLALSGHIGNFELLAAMHARAVERPTVIGREPNYSFLSQWLVDLRTRYGANVLMRPNEHASSRGVARDLIQAFRGKSVIAMLPDQDTYLDREFAPFFGLDAAHPAAPIRLAVRNRAPIMTSFIIRTGPFQHRVVTDEILYDPESESAPREILTEYNRRLQSLVEKYPEQYLWIHRRWRRRPEVDYENEPMKLRSTLDYIAWIRAQEPLCDS